MTHGQSYILNMFLVDLFTTRSTYYIVEECIQLLRQLLSALVYLHGRNPPIVHRDIKSENFLVQYRYAGDIYVKFGDFGPSRERSWKTICGTWKYAAPEINLEKKKYCNSGGRERTRYTAAVDIWSLGVVVFKLLSGLSRYKEEYEDEGALWCENILKKLQEDLGKRPNEVMQSPSTTTPIQQPELRGSAQVCYDRTLLLSGATEDIYHTPTPVSYAEDKQATARPVEHSGHEDPQTVLIDSDEIQRYIRSDIPSATAHGKRAVRVSKSPSSEAKRTKRSKHSGLAAEPLSRWQEEEFGPEMDHLYHNVNQAPLPRSLSGSEPYLVAGGAGYAHDGYLINTIQGQAGGGRSWGDEGQIVEDAYSDEQEVAAALLLAMNNDEDGCEV